METLHLIFSVSNMESPRDCECSAAQIIHWERLRLDVPFAAVETNAQKVRSHLAAPSRATLHWHCALRPTKLASSITPQHVPSFHYTARARFPFRIHVLRVSQSSTWHMALTAKSLFGALIEVV